MVSSGDTAERELCEAPAEGWHGVGHSWNELPRWKIEDCVWGHSWPLIPARFLGLWMTFQWWEKWLHKIKK